jgi:hypothetical protein
MAQSCGADGRGSMDWMLDRFSRLISLLMDGGPNWLRLANDQLCMDAHFGISGYLHDICGEKIK